jgi:hypothetical protein
VTGFFSWTDGVGVNDFEQSCPVGIYCLPCHDHHFPRISLLVKDDSKHDLF